MVALTRTRCLYTLSAPRWWGQFILTPHSRNFFSTMKNTLLQQMPILQGLSLYTLWYQGKIKTLSTGILPSVTLHGTGIPLSSRHILFGLKLTKDEENGISVRTSPIFTSPFTNLRSSCIFYSDDYRPLGYNWRYRSCSRRRCYWRHVQEYKGGQAQ